MKTKNMMFCALLVAMVRTVVSCNPKVCVVDNSAVSEFRSLSGFESIEISGSPTVYYTQADTFSVKVKGPEEKIRDILTSVDNGTLSIRNRGKIGPINVQLGDDGKTAVYVSSPDLINVSLNGSGDFVSDGHVDTDKMSILLRGSGDIDFKDVVCDECQMEVVGSGDLEINSLEAKNVSASLIGSGDIKLNQRNVVTTSLALKGSGYIKVNLTEGCQSVDCELRGSGDITLSGSVERFGQHKSGSGDIDVDHLKIR